MIGFYKINTIYLSIKTINPFSVVYAHELTHFLEGQTAKKLREAVTHGLNQRAIDEIKARECELFNDMNSFLEMIKAA